MILQNIDGNFGNSFKLINDFEITVGATGDYSTIEDAIGNLENKLCRNPKISLQAGTYSEILLDGSENLLFENLEIIGDTRNIAGQKYCDTYDIQGDDTTNGGSGACGLSNSGNDITITGATTNPDFEAAGVVSGDRIITHNNSAVIGVYTIDSVSGNVITLTATAPSIGLECTGLAILPNVELAIPSSKTGVIFDTNTRHLKYLKLSGVYVNRQSTAYNVISVDRRPVELVIEKVVMNGDAGSYIFMDLKNTIATTIGKAVSFWNGAGRSVYAERCNLNFEFVENYKTQGFEVWMSFLNYDNGRLVSDTSNNSRLRFLLSSGFANNVVSFNSSDMAIRCERQSKISAGGCTIKNHSVNGMYAFRNSLIYSWGNAMSGNGTDYSPATSGVLGNYDSYIFH